MLTERCNPTAAMTTAGWWMRATGRSPTAGRCPPTRCRASTSPLQRLDANGNPISGATNQIPFIVRNDGLVADIVLQTSDTTWHAYNGWGGNNGQVGANFYGDAERHGRPSGRSPIPASARRIALTRSATTGHSSPATAEPQRQARRITCSEPTTPRSSGSRRRLRCLLHFGRRHRPAGCRLPGQLQGLHLGRTRRVLVRRPARQRRGGARRRREPPVLERQRGLLEDPLGDRASAPTARPTARSSATRRPGPTSTRMRGPRTTPTSILERYLDRHLARHALPRQSAGGGNSEDVDPISGLYPSCHCAENTLTGQLFGPDGTGEFGGALDVPAALRRPSGLARHRVADGGAARHRTGHPRLRMGHLARGRPPPGRPDQALGDHDSLGAASWSIRATAPSPEPRRTTSRSTATTAALWCSAPVRCSGAGRLSDEHDSSPYGAQIENTDSSSSRSICSPTWESSPPLPMRSWPPGACPGQRLDRHGGRRATIDGPARQRRRAFSPSRSPARRPTTTATR